ncbi:hypothetical protein IJJ02_00970 [Candidatus Saccharibacteria bacterium]|nr:hypothetical protein [Candidatus Saccharibacteria bacterium]
MDNGSNNSAEKHPVRDSANESIRPGFLGGQGGGETPAEGKVNLSREAAADELGNNEAAAASAPSATGAAGLAAGLRKSEVGGGGFFSGTGRSLAEGKKAFNKAKLIKASAGGGVLVAILAVAVLVVGTPIFMIGNLDYNLMGSLGFTNTVNILEEQAEYVTGEQLAKGEVPADYAADLAKAGIQVGQVTVAGDFVPTNKYIANVDELNEIAAVGSGFQANSAEGELAALFDNEVITAADFVAAVESNPKMYMAFTEGADISARYYYSEDVDKTYNAMGLKRWAFQAWEATGDPKVDQNNYDEILKSILDVESSTDGGYDCGEVCSGVNLTGDAEDILDEFWNPNDSAAQLLNSAVSSEESYKAASAFMAIEEPLQRTRIDGDGPANEVMNTLNDDSIEVTYVDVTTGEEVTKGLSIIETPNFIAAASGGGFDKAEAANFSRDRVLKLTDANSWVVEDTVIATDGRKKSEIGVGSIFDGPVDLYSAESSVQIALSDTNANLHTSVVGGNRIVEGGAFLSNMINQHAIGAMPSDAGTVANYSHEVKKVAARKAEAERATRNPFDISSPNTFMGSIAHGLANMMIQNRVTKSPVVSAIGAVMSYAGNATNGLFGGALADGNSKSYLDTSGENCETAWSIGSTADLYCTQNNTIYTGLMDKTKEYWDKKFDDEYYKEYYEDWVKKGMARWVWGTKDTIACGNSGITGVLFNFLDICASGDDVATGAEFVMSDDNPMIKEFSGYTLYNTVASLLSGEQSEASMILEDLYAEEPLDNSRAGIVARRSGMTKREAEVALAYADYLNMVARYDASNRYAFGEVEFEMPEKSLLEEYSEKINGDLYCFWRGRNEYGDVRNRNFA